MPNTSPAFDCSRNEHMMITEAHALNPVVSERVGEREAVTAGHSMTCHRGVAVPMWCSPTPSAHINHSDTNLTYTTAQSCRWWS
jgi:hypothetical protein